MSKLQLFSLHTTGLSKILAICNAAGSTEASHSDLNHAQVKPIFTKYNKDIYTVKAVTS